MTRIRPDYKFILHYFLFLLFVLPLKAQEFDIGNCLAQTIVFAMGEEGYNNFRIPSIVTASDGTLIAIAEGRRDKRGDPGYGHIDLVYKLSHDNGKNWSSLYFLEKSREGWCASNPTTVIDSINNKIIVLYNVWKPGRGALNSRAGTHDNQLWIRTSYDNGNTWSEPGNITRQGRNIKEWSYAVFGPGHGIQTRTGRLVVPVNAPCNFNGEMKSASYVIYSDNGGKNWKRGQQINAPTNENVIVELDDGRLMLDARQNDELNTRWTAISNDQGKSWTDPVPGQVSPRISASIIRYPFPGNNSNSLILWSGLKGPEEMNINPGSKLDIPGLNMRTNLILRISPDQGETFNTWIWIHKGPAAYSAMTMLNNGDLGILWEGGEIPTGTIHFTRISRNIIWKSGIISLSN